MITVHNQGVDWPINADGALVLTVRRRFVRDGLPPLDAGWTVLHVLEGEQDSDGAWIGTPSSVLRAFDHKGVMVDVDPAVLADYVAAMETARAAAVAFDQAIGSALLSSVQ